MKKIYLKPICSIYNISNAAILAGSDVSVHEESATSGGTALGKDDSSWDDDE